MFSKTRFSLNLNHHFPLLSSFPLTSLSVSPHFSRPHHFPTFPGIPYSSLSPVSLPLDLLSWPEVSLRSCSGHPDRVFPYVQWLAAHSKPFGIVQPYQPLLAMLPLDAFALLNSHGHFPKTWMLA